MQETNNSHWDAFTEGFEQPQNSASLYPTPPGSTDSYLESTSFPTLLGLTQPPTPMFYESSYTASPEADAVINASSTEVEEEEHVLRVSTSFYPGSHTAESDLTVSSLDGVLFYFHSSIIADAASRSTVQALLQYATVPGASLHDAGIIPLPFSAIIVTITFHTIYGSSCAQNSPSTSDLLTAVDLLPSFNAVPSALIKPGTPTYALLLSHAPLKPLDIYALAAHHDIRELAKNASSHLLTHPLEAIDDTIAARIGTHYLTRLFFLRMNRLEAVKAILVKPPGFHPATRQCNLDKQRRVTRAWALGSTYLALDQRPDLSTHRIESIFEPLIEELDCKDCEKMLRKRIREAVVSWAAIQTTI